MRYLLITEPRSGTSVRVDMLDRELPEQTLHRWLSIDKLFSRQLFTRDEGVGFVEWYETETNNKVEVVTETRRVTYKETEYAVQVDAVMKKAFPDAYVDPMGDGQTAWWINVGHMYVHTPKQRYALITHHESDAYGNPNEKVWMSGFYGVDCDQLELESDITLEQALSNVRLWLLADKFAMLLREGLGEVKFQEVRRRNVDHKDDGICASHDFCNAYMVMLDAFKEIIGREAVMSEESEERPWQHDMDCGLMRLAWSIAKRHYLTQGGKGC
jgi:hypothetical protein